MSVYECVLSSQGGTVTLVEHTVREGSLPVVEPA